MGASLDGDASTPRAFIVTQIADGNQRWIDARQTIVKARSAATQVVSTRQRRGQHAFNTSAAARINRNSVMRLAAAAS